MGFGTIGKTVFAHIFFQALRLSPVKYHFTDAPYTFLPNAGSQRAYQKKQLHRQPLIPPEKKTIMFDESPLIGGGRNFNYST
jgi:hypothetical protein